MPRRPPGLYRLARLLLLPACIFCTSAQAQSASDESVSVIANQSVHVGKLETSTLRAIFSMRMRQWPDGEPIRVFVLPDQHPVHLIFTKRILRVFPFVLRDQWDRLTFTGTGRPPTLVESEEELMKRVNETPGAIGYSSRPDASIVNLISISENRQHTTNSRLANTLTMARDIP